MFDTKKKTDDKAKSKCLHEHWAMPICTKTVK